MDATLRAFKFARSPSVTVAEACARYGVTRGRYYRAMKEHGAELVWSLEDTLLGALVRQTTPVVTADLIEYVDWVDHVRYDRESWSRCLTGFRAAASSSGRSGGGWVLRGEWP